MVTTTVMERLADAGVVAIVRAGSSEHVSTVAATLIDCGIDCLELTMTTPDALATLGRLREAHPGACLGVGTVTDAARAAAAIEAGAEFLVSPNLDREAISRAVAHGVPMLAGALTPTEVLAAHRAGAAAVKVFPISNVGGVAYIKALRGPFPEIPLAPTGGVAIEDIQSYLRAGCICVGLGSPLLGDAASGGSLDDLAERTKRVIDAVAKVRSDA